MENTEKDTSANHGSYKELFLDIITKYNSEFDEPVISYLIQRKDNINIDNELLTKITGCFYTQEGELPGVIHYRKSTEENIDYEFVYKDLLGFLVIAGITTLIRNENPNNNY